MSYTAKMAAFLDVVGCFILSGNLSGHPHGTQASSRQMPREKTYSKFSKK